MSVCVVPRRLCVGFLAIRTLARGERRDACPDTSQEKYDFLRTTERCLEMLSSLGTRFDAVPRSDSHASVEVLRQQQQRQQPRGPPPLLVHVTPRSCLSSTSRLASHTLTMMQQDRGDGPRWDENPNDDHNIRNHVPVRTKLIVVLLLSFLPYGLPEALMPPTYRFNVPTVEDRRRIRTKRFIGGDVDNLPFE